MTAPDTRPRILSGVQPSGRLHLGNYFGAIRQHIDLQQQGNCYYFIADYHALTSLKDAEQLRRNTFDVALTYLALGLDPERTVFYRQSDVPEVTELAWLLATATGMGLLERAHSYKEKVVKGISPSVGLFFYPVLMAADILAPQADIVPVGQDQEQHVEMTRDMVALFHNAFCKDRSPVFRLPEARMSSAPRVPGTTFEKGSVLQVTTEVVIPPAPGVLHPYKDYVAEFRSLIEGILSTEGPTLQTTEALERRVAKDHAKLFPTVHVVTRQLRALSEMPANEIHATPRHDTPSLILEFVIPMDRTMFVTKDGRRVAAKMSKSYGNTIEIFAEGKDLKKLVMGIETQLKSLEDPLDPEEDLVFALYSLFASEQERVAMAQGYRAGGYGFGRAKKELLAKIEQMFEVFRQKRRTLAEHPDQVEDVLRDGAKKARAVARATVDAARSACGLAG